MIYDAESVEIVNKLDNKIFLGDTFSNVLHLKDCIEDSNTAEEMAASVNKLSNFKWTVDRDTPYKTRLVSKDGLGNLRYLKVNKRKEQA